MNGEELLLIRDLNKVIMYKKDSVVRGKFLEEGCLHFHNRWVILAPFYKPEETQ